MSRRLDDEQGAAFTHRQRVSALRVGDRELAAVGDLHALDAALARIAPAVCIRIVEHDAGSAGLRRRVARHGQQGDEDDGKNVRHGGTRHRDRGIIVRARVRRKSRGLPQRA